MEKKHSDKWPCQSVFTSLSVIKEMVELIHQHRLGRGRRYVAARASIAVRDRRESQAEIGAIANFYLFPPGKIKGERKKDREREVVLQLE